MNDWRALTQWAYLYGKPQLQGQLRASAEDFWVDEQLGFAPDGEGQHRLLHIEKRNTNTEWLARQIARLAGVANKDVGYAGLKDRNAVTRQWFSVDLAGRAEPDWSQLVSADVQVLEVSPHGRKLRRGSLQGNNFRLRITGCEGARDGIESRLQRIAAEGVPNYFMEQRFGRDFGNLDQAQTMFNGRRVKDRHLRSLYLSAARSLVFNQILSQRIQQGLWDKILDGDVMMLDGSHSIFVAGDEDDELVPRLQQHDIHLTAALWGRGHLSSEGQAQAFEQGVITTSGLEDWCQGLEQAGLKQERRALRVLPQDLHWQIEDDTLVVAFGLPAGSYATAVLREVVQAVE